MQKSLKKRYHFQCQKISSKMDLKQGYHQLTLHPKSRAIATFSTPRRLIFGAKSSHDFFYKAMFRNFGDIPKCLNQRDDIFIGGVTMTDHNTTLKAVLERARDFGITFNKTKCQFGVQDIEFFGYRFTSEELGGVDGSLHSTVHEQARSYRACNIFNFAAFGFL
jgi:hypothetical protein